MSERPWEHRDLHGNSFCILLRGVRLIPSAVCEGSNPQARDMHWPRDRDVGRKRKVSKGGREGRRETRRAERTLPEAKKALILLTPTGLRSKGEVSRWAALSGGQQSTREEVRTFFYLNKAAGEEVTPFPPYHWLGRISSAATLC